MHDHVTFYYKGVNLFVFVDKLLFYIETNSSNQNPLGALSLFSLKNLSERESLVFPVTLVVLFRRTLHRS
ncbi:unnamed protein product [Brassica oleracea var. botrytis]